MLVYVILADIYSVRKQQRLIGILNGTIAIAMTIALVIGSYVNLFWDWFSNFVLLLIVGLISLILGILFIPKREANKKIRVSLKKDYLSSNHQQLHIIYL